jgi:hypothetical protein
MPERGSSVSGRGRSAFRSKLGFNVVDLTTGQAWLQFKKCCSRQ